MVTSHDREVIRRLAQRVAEIAEHPDQDRRREIWFRQNRLQRGKPPVFVSPEGA